MFFESHGVEVWNTNEKESFISNHSVESVEQPKCRIDWMEDDKKKFIYDKRPKIL